jgi:hypothetical protein
MKGCCTRNIFFWKSGWHFIFTFSVRDICILYHLEVYCVLGSKVCDLVVNNHDWSKRFLLFHFFEWWTEILSINYSILVFNFDILVNKIFLVMFTCFMINWYTVDDIDSCEIWPTKTIRSNDDTH